jgi:hypothetical protein
MSSIKIQGYINMPRQKLSDSKKTDEWWKKNIDFAENILVSDFNLRSSFKNKRTNYNLRANIINNKDFERYINPDQLDLTSLPATFQHVGIENTKIDLLLGEYSKRRKEYRAFLSANDKEGVSRKEETLKKELDARIVAMITKADLTPEEIQKELQNFDKYRKYDHQDIAEITANKILKREYKEQDFDYLFLRTFEDLLTAGEQIVYCGVLGGEPVMRRVNTQNLYTLGGNSMYIEDSDIIVEYGYKSVGQVIDDYWDELTDSDIDFLETGGQASKTAGGGAGIGLNRDISVFDRFGDIDEFQIFHPNELGNRTFAGAFDTYGNVRVLKVCWRSRRKIGRLKYFDEDGQEQETYVPEDYQINKINGEEVKWMWVNEWLEGTKIGDNIYLSMRPIPFASKSLVNKSKGIPPYIGSVNSTNDYKVQSLMDVMKPLTYSFDIAYYKRELAIATYKGSFAAINSALVPSGWDPKEWMRYATVNKFAWLDPTNEILKGPSQGKSAGAFNQLTATSVQIGDPNEIQMYTNILLDIENTLGKVSGVSGAREGQIQNRQAVGNVEREVAQTSHITEKWFALDANFRKRALTKFLECCKYAYKKNPKRGQFLLDDMGQEMIQSFDEFCASEMDIHVSNSTSDTELYEDLRILSQAAIQNGQAKLADIIAVKQSESVQEIARKLEASSEKIQEEQQQAQQAQMQSDQQNAQLMAQDKQAEREWKTVEAEKDRELKREEINLKRELGHASNIASDIRDTRKYDNTQEPDADLDNNGIKDTIDIRRTDIDERYKNEKIRLEEAALAETIRKNKAEEVIKKQKKSE